MARQGLVQRSRGGAVQRFARPVDSRPAKLAPNVKGLGELWQEWEHGIAGSKPAKEWTKNETAGNSSYSRRLPVWLLLERLIVSKKKLPAEAFRLLELFYGERTSITKMGVLIRKQELNGSMPPALADLRVPLALQKPRKKRQNGEI